MIDEESKIPRPLFVVIYGYHAKLYSGESTRILMFIHGRTRIKKCLCSIREENKIRINPKLAT